MSSQLDQVLVELRERILNGDLKPGERLAEVPLAEQLHVSRTPVRHALTLLEAEGLLEPSGSRGFVVRRFSFQDITDAIDVRGVLEGLAARMVAEHGVTRRLRHVLDDCVERVEAMLSKDQITSDDLVTFARINGRFHGGIVEEAGNAALANALSMNDKLPFAAAASVAWEMKSEADRRRTILTAQIEHGLIRDALIAGEGARAEALMKEHANVAKMSVRALATDKAEPGEAVSNLSNLLAS